MVNVPPIPPLLCSTPPPIDFGDEDDDVDVLPPTLGGVDVDEEFGDSKSDEPLPSPRSPSVDLPPVSIYDGLLPPDEPYTKHSETPPPMDTGIATSETANKPQQSIQVVEAFNYSITQQQAREALKETPDEDVHEHESTIPTTQGDTTLNDGSDNLEESSQSVMGGNNAGVEGKQLQVADEEESKSQQEPVIHDESNVISVKPDICLLSNIVSIEDLEDDLSEDELYSPKTPKNLKEEDALDSEYFKIHDILQQTNTKQQLKETISAGIEQEEDTEMKSAPVTENVNRFTNFPSQEFTFNTPPPLDEEYNNMDAENDFGDFADFQDFNTNIAVAPQTIIAAAPSLENNIAGSIKEAENKELSYDSEDDFDDFVQHTQPNEANRKLEQIQPIDLQGSADNDIDEFMKHTASVSMNINQVQNDNLSFNDDYRLAKDSAEFRKIDDGKCVQLQQNLDDSFGDFNEFPDKDKEPKEAVEIAENVHELTNNCSEENSEIENLNENEDFSDFADFQESQAMPELKSNDNAEVTQNNVAKSEETKGNDGDFDDDDDDDFGDFNTAEPVESKPVPTIQQPSQSLSIPNTTAAAPVSLQMPKNLNERISKILHVMFTSANDTSSSASTTSPSDADVDIKTQKIQDIPFTSIDAAKALEYQWLHSETRHSFIKSLGIDSRNILYGENWNPSLPRFAANLSFNPLKPMKPVTSNSGAETIPCPPLESVPVNNTSEFNKSIINPLANIKRDNIEVDWKIMPEQKTEALNDNTSSPEVPNTTASVNPMPYVATEPPESLTIFENPLDIDDKFSKTPPISEMESVNTFSSPLPSLTALEIELPPAATQIVNTFKTLELNEANDAKDSLEVVVASTTFSGSFKETHIYTPPKTNENSSSTSSTSTTSPTKTTTGNNIDFDYEKAAMGVIIDETVVKKEYRDIEYNSPFTTMDSLTRTSSLKSQDLESSNTFGNPQSMNAFNNDGDDDFNDEFSDFQSVPTSYLATNAPNTALPNLKPVPPNRNGNPSPIVSEVPKTTNVSACGMILSPAILIPQAISMESNKPKIEWGDSTAAINPEELARIEELFPDHTKVAKSSTSTSSQKSTPTHQALGTLSAAVANKELEGNNDDDDWSDFVSVPVANNNKTASLTNNNAAAKNQKNSNSPFKQRSPVNTYKTQYYNNSNNDDDDWSDFVSSAPQEPHAAVNTQGSTHRVVPQFNSGAWQNANLYHNPLSLYHKGINLHNAAAAANQQQSPKNFLNNNNNYSQYNNHFQTATSAGGHGHQQQMIHVMQNFSTAPVPTPERLTGSATKNNQFQVGSAKVAPSIALIPDLGFVAPAIPTHTSFINSLPKPSINTKK